MLIWVGIGLAVMLAAWLFHTHKTKAPSTLVGRTEARKRVIQDEFLTKWREARQLGSTETVSDWLKRKLPSLQTDWLEKNRAGLSDEALIVLSLNYLFSQPYFIEWLLESDREAQAGETAE